MQHPRLAAVTRCLMLFLAGALAMSPTRGLAQTVALTPAEQAYIRTAPPVVVGVQADYAPFSFVGTDGVPTGYSNELFALVARKTGLRYRFAEGEPWDVLLEQARQGKVNVLTCLGLTPERERFLDYAGSYLHQSVGWAVRSDDPLPPDDRHTVGKVVVLARDFAINDELRRRFPKALFLEVETAADALRLVSLGKADAYVDNIGMINYVTAQEGYANVRIHAMINVPTGDFYMAVPAGSPPELQSIIGKGLKAVTEPERRALEDRWLHDEVPFWQTIQPYLSRVLLVVLAVLAALGWLVHVNRKLHESRERAHAANRAKSAFLAAMSHEIRTPMIGVTGMIEVLSHTRLDGEQRQALDIIRDSTQSLLQVIGDILDFSKIEAGKMGLSIEPNDMRRVLGDMVRSFEGAATSRGLTLECHVDADVAEGYAFDALRVRQVVGNFLSNAIKFTHEGGIVVALAAREVGADGDLLAFSVTDTGIGISPEQREQLFQPFTQAEADTARHYGGTGLGLAIAMRLAELMGGTVEMDSVPGQGTTLRLLVRFLRAQLPARAVIGDSVARQALAPPTIEDARRDGRLVLLVDDHPVNRTVIVRQLGLAGFAAEAASDGSEALTRWREGRYALLLCDVHMPGLDGYQLARAIRVEERRSGRPRTPLIALTASAEEGEAGRCRDAGMDDCLTKPVTAATLATAISHWLPAAGGAPSEMSGEVTRHARDVLDDFIASTNADLAALGAARKAGDHAGVASSAHRIKGAALILDARALAEVAGRLELAARKDKVAEVDALLPELDAAWAGWQTGTAGENPQADAEV